MNEAMSEGRGTSGKDTRRKRGGRGGREESEEGRKRRQGGERTGD